MTRRPCTQSGFTLIELMAVVTVATILALVAAPAFQAQATTPATSSLSIRVLDPRIEPGDSARITGHLGIAGDDKLVVDDPDRYQVERHAQLPTGLLTAILRTLKLPLSQLPFGLIGGKPTDQLVTSLDRPDRIGDLTGRGRQPVVVDGRGGGGRHDVTDRANLNVIRAGGMMFAAGCSACEPPDKSSSGFT